MSAYTGTTRGTATFNGGLAVADSVTLVPGSTTATGTITASTLAFSGNNTLAVNLGDLGTDAVNVTSAGGLTHSGTTTIQVTPNGSISTASTFYPIISYTGASPGTGGFVLGALPGHVSASVTDSGSAIGITATNDRVIWTGAADSNWDGTVLNWIKSSDSSATTFLAQDDVLFNDVGIAWNTVYLVGTINPSRVEFAQTSGTYTLASGTLSGTGSVYQTGAGSTILLNANTYAGPTTVNAGTLELDTDSGTMTATSVVNVGAAGTFRISKDDGDIAFSRPLTGAGSVRVNPHAYSGGTTAARGSSLSGDGTGFSGTLILEAPLIGSARMNATPPASVGTASIVVQNENQFYTNNATYTNSITITGDGYNDTSGSIGALRMDGGTWNGTVSVTGTAGDSGGTAYDARIGSNGGTNIINGSISGGDVSFWAYGTSGPTFVVGSANSYGDTIIGGADNTSASAGTLTYVLGDTATTPANTTASFGTGNVYLVTGNNVTNPTAVVLRIRRADGYALAGNILGSSSNSATLGRLTLQADTTGAGLTLNGKTVDISDGTNGGLVRVATNNTGAVVNIGAGSVLDAGSFHVGEAAGYAAAVNQSGGTSTVINQLRVGHYGSETSTYNLSGGSVGITAANGATNPFTAGTTEQNGGIYVGVDGTGIFNQSGGTVNTNWVVLDNRGDTAGVDQYNLTGGTLNINNSWGISGNASTLFTLGGGTLVANNAGPIDVPVSVPVGTAGSGSVLNTLNAGNTFTFSKDVTGTGTVTTQGGGAVRFSTTGSQMVTANMAGTNPVTKLGTGTTSFTGTNTYTGATSVNAGRLNLVGSVSGSNVTVANGAAVGGEATTASLTFGSNVADVTTLYADASTPGAMTSTGTLTVNGTVNVDFSATPSISGTYVVLNHGGTAATSANFALVNSASYRGTPAFSVTGAQVTVTLNQLALLWNGTTANWEIAGTDTDWNTTDQFYTGDAVRFDDTPGAIQAVAMVGALKPKSVTIANSVYDYSFTGAAGNGIGGTTSVAKSGDGWVTLGGDNTFTGGLSIDAGTLNVGSNTALGGDGNAITVAAEAQLNFKGLAQDPVRSYSLTIAGDGPDDRGAVTNDTTVIYENARILNLVLSADATVGAYGGALPTGNRFDIGRAGTLTGTITGNSHTLTKVGDAMIDLRAPATNISYVVNAGALRAENTELAFGSTGVTANSGGTVDTYGTLNFTVPLVLNDGSALTSSNGTATWGGAVTFAGGTVTLGGSATLVMASGITESASTNLATTGGGTTVLPSANPITGKTTVTTGILRIASNASLGAVPGAPVADAITLQSGGRIQAGNATAGLDLTLDANRGIYLPNGDGGLHVWTGFTMNYAGNVTGTGNFLKSDGGTLNYTGTASHTGATTVSAGVMNLNGATLVANNNINLTGGTTNVNTGTAWTTTGVLNIQTATLNITGGSLTTGRFVTDNASAASTTVNQSGGTVTITGTDSSNTNTASFLFGHWGTGNTSTYNLSGGTLNSIGAELSFGWDTSTSIFNLTGGAANLLGLDIGNTRTNLAVFNLNGGRLNLGANGITTNTSKIVNLMGGTLGAFADWSSSQAMAVPGSANPMTVDTLDSADGTTARSITLSGVLSGIGSLVKSGTGTLNLSATNTYTGGTTVNAGTLSLNGGGGANGTIRGTVTVNSGATLQLNSGDVTGYDATTRLGVINLAGGTMHVNTISNQTLGNGVVNMTGAAITGVAGSNLDFFQTTSALNSLASSTQSTVAGVQLQIRQTAGLTISVASGSVPGGTDLAVSSVIANHASFITAPLFKAGGGTLELKAANTCTGPVTVSAGKLLVNNTTGSGTGAGAVSVTTGATLGGTGTLAGATTVSGTIAPGNSVGTLSFGSLVNLAAGSTYAVEINGASSNDKIVTATTLNASGTIAVTLSGYTPVAGDAFDIADAASITGTPTFDFSAASLTAGLTWDTTSFTTTGVIKVVGSDPYGAWATSLGVTGGKAGDDDGDGVSNLLEFATNGDPKSGSSGARTYGKMHVLSGQNVLTFTVATRKSATFAADGTRQTATKDLVKYTVEGTSDLATWTGETVTELNSTDAASVRSAMTLPTLDADWEWHTFRTGDHAAIDSTDIIRLKVEEAP